MLKKCALRRVFRFPPIEPLTKSSAAAFQRAVVSNEEAPESSASFPVRYEEIGDQLHGLTLEARQEVLNAELEQHSHQGGPSPTYVPSWRQRAAHRGYVGEIEHQKRLKELDIVDESAKLNLKKERELESLLRCRTPPLEKARQVAALLLSSFVMSDLALQPRTAEEVLLLFSSVSLSLRMKGVTAPDADSGFDAVPFLKEMRTLYTLQKRNFCTPTPLMLEHLMVTVASISEPDRKAFQFSCRLLLDSEKFVFLPSRATFASFFDVCRVNNEMPVALLRAVDAQENLLISFDGPMAASLIKGLNETGYVEEAVMLLSRLQHVPMTLPFLNASLETFLLSKQPLSCFSAFEAVVSDVRAITPNADTYTLLLLACEQSSQWDRVTFILDDMQKRRVKGNSQTLNLLLKGLLVEDMIEYATQLRVTMLEKEVTVWPHLDSALSQRQRALQPPQK